MEYRLRTVYNFLRLVSTPTSQLQITYKSPSNHLQKKVCTHALSSDATRNDRELMHFNELNEEDAGDT